MVWRSRSNKPELDATKIPSLIDIAWSAGIYEGEGSIRLCGRGKRSLAGSVPQKEPEILYELRDWFGGSVCIPWRKQACHTWNICGDRARIFIALIYPYLSSRRRSQVDATDALDFLDGKSPESMTQEDLALYLAAFYEMSRSNTWYGSNRAAVRKANYQIRKIKDPEFLPKLLARNKAWKDKQVAGIEEK